MKSTPAKNTTPAKAAPKKASSPKKPVKKATPAKKKPVAPAKKPVAKKPVAPAKNTAAKKPVAKKAMPKAPAKKAVAVKKAPVIKQEKKAAAKPPVKPMTTKVTQAQVPVKKEAVKKALAPKAAAAKQLTKSDIQKFQKMLLIERDHLIASINNIEETSRTESGRDNGADLASFAETGTDSFNIETALNIASSESQRLRDVLDALDRIARGTYGICEGSGKLIPNKRLEAFPSARYCVEYQQEVEKEAAMNEYR